MSWTEKRVSEFRVMFDDNMSFGCIAAQMHLSRNAVIGKAHRLGWPRRKNTSPTQSLPRAKRATAFAVRRTPFAPRPALSPVPVAPPPEPEPAVITTEHMARLMDLDPHMCRFPLWTDDTPSDDQWFCGTPTANVLDGRPYCPGHHRIAFDKPRRNPPRVGSAWLQAAE